MAALEARGIHKAFGGFLALAGVDLEVASGERRTVIGPNGAGKSTLFRIVGGELRPDRGAVRIFDREATPLPPHRRALLGLARTYQIASLFPEKTAREHVLLALLARDPRRRSPWPLPLPDLEARAAEVLDQVGLRGREDLPIHQLTYGEQRQVEIALALAQEPRLLLLDEPLAGLGGEERARVAGLIRGLPRSITVLLIEHDLDFAYAFADRVTVLHQGQVLREGPPQEVRADPQVVEVYVGGRLEGDPALEAPVGGDGPAPGLLEVRGLRAGYGQGEVLHGVDLAVGEGEVVALLGRNGMGKTTLLKALMGLIPAQGEVRLAGEPLPAGALARARAGLALVPQGRQMIPGLTVEEELLLAWRPGRWTPERVYRLFPRLKERRQAPSTALSGGEQQMLALARALLRNPRILLLDEPTEGLAPLMVRHLGEVLKEVAREGETILLAEQNAAFALPLAQRAYLLDRGRIVGEERARTLLERPERIWERMG
ncbi:hypothetical protein YIM1640_21940 [Thermus oshimai]|uniref:ATP-binding cassette domain-containing protein n=1 Tax=Thermus oshimai TaxID=56957 RepID=UPI000368C669|nr:ATP-binding cassette domain-containing protein [Thermus oshimai]